MPSLPLSGPTGLSLFVHAVKTLTPQIRMAANIHWKILVFIFMVKLLSVKIHDINFRKGKKKILFHKKNKHVLGKKR
jgi:hypothetical protein